MAARVATALTVTFAYDKDEKKKIGMDRGIFWEASMALSKEAFLRECQRIHAPKN